MTSKEALERLVKQANARKLSNKIVVNRWDYEKLLELAERDTPKKVCYDNLGRSKCPSCDMSYLYNGRMNRNKYCGYCGQRLEWEE